MILGADNATDKVFRDLEQSIGVEKLIEVNAGEKIFSSPSSSIHTLALIAIAKLLPPSHGAHSISLCEGLRRCFGWLLLVVLMLL